MSKKRWRCNPWRLLYCRRQHNPTGSTTKWIADCWYRYYWIKSREPCRRRWLWLKYWRRNAGSSRIKNPRWQPISSSSLQEVQRCSVNDWEDPGWASPIWRSPPDSYDDNTFNVKALIEMPMKFSFPNMRKYNGTGDPDNHIAMYKKRMLTLKIHKELKKAIMCKGFCSTLGGPTLQWYINLPNGSIRSFAILTDQFMEPFTSSRNQEKTADNLYEIFQNRAEPLCSYITRFNP